MWYNLKIGYWDIKYTPIKPKTKEYEYCDENGNVLKKVAGTYQRGHFIDEKNGKKFDVAFRLIKGKPMAKLNKTKEVANYKEVDHKEVDDLIVEKQYLVEGDGLLNDLNTTNKVLKFAYTSGNGFKVYFAYLFPSKLYKGFMEMYLGTTKKSEVVMDIIDLKKQSEKAKTTTKVIKELNVDKAKVEDLLTL